MKKIYLIIFILILTINNKVYATFIPNRYSLADNYNILVENQGLEGNCWTFASLETLETYLQIHGYGTYNFSENHLNYIESNLFLESTSMRDVNTTGNFEEFIDYMNKQLGPVLEDDFPYYENNNYKNYSSNELDNLLNINPIAYVDEYTSFPSINKEYQEYSDLELLEFRNMVKKHIMENGSLYTLVVAPTYYSGEYYNPDTYAAYFSNSNDYTFSSKMHAVSIIGWDDSYSRDNFVSSNKPIHDGAYIILNSWGREFGDDGLYYISYDDVYVEKDLRGIKSAVINKEDLKNTTTLQFNDINLYNGLKDKLDIISYDDNNKSIVISNDILSSITTLDLNNLNITDLTGIEKLTNLMTINLSNNNISNIEPLSKLYFLSSINLNYNNLSDIPEVLINLDNLSLNYNPITNFNNLDKIKSIKSLELEGTNFNDEDLKQLKNIEINRLNISKTNTTDYSILQGKDIEYLDISYNNILYDTIPSVYNLNISHTNTFDYDLKKIDISNINSIDISYTNIKDLSLLPEYLKYINISGNTDLINFDRLKYTNTIYYQDSNIEDVSMFNDFLVSYLYLDNNNIKDYTSLLDNDNLMILSLSNNKLTDIIYNDNIMFILDNNYINPIYGIYGNIYSLKGQYYEEELLIDTSRDNIFTNIANTINYLSSSGYNLTIDNGTMDYENNKFIIKDTSKDVIITITNGKLESSIIKYKIKQVDNTNINYIYVDNIIKNTYVEGDNIDISNIRVYASYDNGSISEINDYLIFGLDNLEIGNNTITIEKDGYTGYFNIEIIPYNDVVTLKFDNEEIYQATLNKIKQIEKEREMYSDYFNRTSVIINNDIVNKTIRIYKDDLLDINYIEINSDYIINLDDLKMLKGLRGIGINSKYFNIDQINIIKEILDSRDDISDYEKLIDLTINNNENIKTINDNIFKSLTINNSNIIDINNLTNLFYLKYSGNNDIKMDNLLDNLEIIDINITVDINSLKRDSSNNIILPDIFKLFKDLGFCININIYNQIRDEIYLNAYNIQSIDVIDKDNNLIIDYKDNNQLNQFIEISVIDNNHKYTVFNYKYKIINNYIDNDIYESYIEDEINIPVENIEDNIENKVIEEDNKIISSNTIEVINPKTNDNIINYIMILIISIISMVICVKKISFKRIL